MPLSATFFHRYVYWPRLPVIQINGMDTKQPKDHPPVPKRNWVNTFLVVNLIIMSLIIVWELVSPLAKSDEEKNVAREKDTVIVKTYLDKNPEPKDLTGTLGPVLQYTVDATIQDRWAHFSFSKGTVFYREKIDNVSQDWDIAFRRAKIITNGGSTNPIGKAEVASIKTGDLSSVEFVPAASEFQPDLTTQNILETKNPVLDKWYKYDFWEHRLTPNDEVYVARTAKGDYVKFKIIDYYCGHISGCYTIRYVYLGNGSDSFISKP